MFGTLDDLLFMAGQIFTLSNNQNFKEQAWNSTAAAILCRWFFMLQQMHRTVKTTLRIEFPARTHLRLKGYYFELDKRDWYYHESACQISKYNVNKIIVSGEAYAM